jgi:RNA polymerase sigma-70 factor (ECF subfamily)
MNPRETDTDALIERAQSGDDSACQQLLIRHRPRLRRMIAVHLDNRLAARLDPSDVVQEALTDAARKLADYLQRQPLPFYPWLRQLAWERLVKVHRRHLHAQKRAATREAEAAPGLSGASADELGRRLLAGGPSPSKQLARKELQARVQAALGRLPDPDREVVILRYLEQLTTAEIAAVLGITESAAKSRHFRALERLRVLLGNEISGASS